MIIMLTAKNYSQWLATGKLGLPGAPAVRGEIYREQEHVIGSISVQAQQLSRRNVVIILDKWTVGEIDF
jgi:hypothetical protein